MLGTAKTYRPPDFGMLVDVTQLGPEDSEMDVSPEGASAVFVA